LHHVIRKSGCCHDDLSFSRPVGSRPVGSDLQTCGVRPVGSRPVGSRPVGSRPVGSDLWGQTDLEFTSRSPKRTSSGRRGPSTFPLVQESGWPHPILWYRRVGGPIQSLDEEGHPRFLWYRRVGGPIQPFLHSGLEGYVKSQGFRRVLVLGYNFDDNRPVLNSFKALLRESFGGPYKP